MQIDIGTLRRIISEALVLEMGGDEKRSRTRDQRIAAPGSRLSVGPASRENKRFWVKDCPVCGEDMELIPGSKKTFHCPECKFPRA